MPRSLQATAGAAVALAGAALLAAGAFLLAWWTGSAGELAVRVDLRGLELCSAGDCARRALDAVGAGALAWARLALAAQLAAAIAATVVIAAAASRLAGRPAPTLSWAGAVLSLFAAALGGAVLWTVPDLGGELEPAFGIACYLAGAGLAAVGASMLRRSR